MSFAISIGIGEAVVPGRIVVHDGRVRTNWGVADGSQDSVARLADRAAAITVIAVRMTFCAQLALAVPQGLGRAERPWLFGVLSGGALAESVLLMGFVWRSRRVGRSAAFADVGFACLAIAAEPLYSSRSDRVGTWVAWGFGIGCVAALTVGAGLRRRRDAGVAMLLLAAVYLAVSLPSQQPVTAAVNSVALVGFATGSHLVAGFLHELARIADQARTAAAVAGQEAERERQRRLLHDQATVLALLSREHDDPVLEGVLRTQAATASQRIRAFLGDTRTVEAAPSGGRPLLVDVVAAAAEDFGDLPITVNTDLVLGVRIASEHAEVLLAVITTLLHNVRRHAGAGAVTVHGDRVGGDRWELSVADDGLGFDPDNTALGYGLGTLIGHASTVAGFAVDVDSAPGEGTRVTITSGGPDVSR